MEIPLTKVRRTERGPGGGSGHCCPRPPPLSLQVEGLPKARTRVSALCSLGSVRRLSSLEIPAQHPPEQPSINDPLSLHLVVGWGEPVFHRAPEFTRGLASQLPPEVICFIDLLTFSLHPIPNPTRMTPPKRLTLQFLSQDRLLGTNLRQVDETGSQPSSG